MLRNLGKTLKENFFDTGFREYRGNYITQCVIIFACLSAIMFLYEFFGGIIVGSLGASSFILFITPHVNLSRARYVIGSYICAAVIGNLCGLLYETINSGVFGIGYGTVFICACAAALTAFVMVITNLEHPPAAALALGLVADDNRLITSLAALSGVIILCTARRAIRKHLRNLL